MADLLLSQSLLQNNDALQTQRDPFQAAQQQYQSKVGSQDSGNVLSSSQMTSSPFTSPTPSVDSSSVKSAGPSDYQSLLSNLGVDSSGITTTDAGKNVLIQRLKDKFGDSFSTRDDVANVFKAFSAQSTKALEAANRTLGLLLSGASQGTQITGGIKRGL